MTPIDRLKSLALTLISLVAELNRKSLELMELDSSLVTDSHLDVLCGLRRILKVVENTPGFAAGDRMNDVLAEGRKLSREFDTQAWKYLGALVTAIALRKRIIALHPTTYTRLCSHLEPSFKAWDDARGAALATVRPLYDRLIAVLKEAERQSVVDTTKPSRRMTAPISSRDRQALESRRQARRGELLKLAPKKGVNPAADKHGHGKGKKEKVA